MHKPDLKIVHGDFVGASENLKAVASGFRDNAQTVEDIRCALGHDRLADKLGDFADSWRIKREKMQEAFEALAAEIQRQLDDWTKLDDTLSGRGQKSPDESRRGGPDGGPEQQPAPGRPEGPGPTPSPRAEPAPSLPSPVPSPTAESPPTAPAPMREPTAGIEHPITPHLPDRITSDLPPESIEIMVDENEDTFRAVLPAAVAGGGIAALLALFRIWQGQRPSPADVPRSDLPTPGGGLLTPEQRLMAEFERIRGEGQVVDVSLIRDLKDPGDVLAILQGADGAESIIDLNPENGSGVGPGVDAVDGDPRVDPAAEPPGGSVAPPSEESASQTGFPVADTAAPLAPAAGLSDGGAAPMAPGNNGADPSRPPEAPVPFGGSPSVDAPSSTSAEGVAPISDSSALDGEGAQPHAVAGATAGMGMMGMGAANAAQATSGGAAGTRLKQEDLKRPHEQDVRRKDGDQ